MCGFVTSIFGRPRLFLRLQHTPITKPIYTQNSEEPVKAGMTHVNDITVNDEAHVMFGGEKNSGLGRFNGEWAIEEFTTDHWISVSEGTDQFPF